MMNCEEKEYCDFWLVAGDQSEILSPIALC